MGRFDLQIGQQRPRVRELWHQRAPAKFVSTLPQAIANETYSDPQNSWVNRLNYDRMFSNTLLNHMSMGYLNRNEGYGSVNQDFVDDFPADCRRRRHTTCRRRSTSSDGFAELGSNAGVNVGNITTRPTFIINDLVTWTKSGHTLKVGMEYRNIMGNIHANTNQAGTFDFGRGATGLVGVNSGSPIASFLLGAVDNGELDFPRRRPNIPAAERVDRPCRRHLAGERQAHARLRPALGLLLAIDGEVRPLLLLRSGGRQPGRRRAAGTARVCRRRYGAASFGAQYPEKIGTAGSRRAWAASSRSTTRR